MGAKVRNVLGLGEVSAAGLPGETGVLVLEVAAGSPAERAGLKPNDIVVRLGTETITSLDDLERTASQTGKPAAITIVRDQREMKIAVP